jgi:thiamine biosynthesis lipoprotein
VKPLRAMHYVMGTLLECTLFDIPEAPGRWLLHQGVQEVRRLEHLLSAHDPESALSRLNRQAGCGPVQVEAELWHLLDRCAALTCQTDGAFDISVGTLTRRECQAGPETRVSIPCPAFRLSAHEQVELAAGACLDLGGIGKGYAVDRLIELWRVAGVARACVNFGESSLALLGEPPDEPGWPILVRGLAEEEVLGVLWVQDCALSTSQSLGRNLETGAPHILDPRTGLSIQRPCLSTILAPSATLAEALSTAVIASGTAWTTLLARFPAAEGLYVSPDRVLHCTAGLARWFQPWAEVL